MSDSIRDALTAAYDAAESDETPDTAPVDTAPDTSDVADESPDNAGVESASDSDSTSGTTPAPAAAPAPSSPAPASWNAAEKAAWGSMSPAAQAAVQRREVELNRVLQTSAQARKSAQEYDAAFEPYDALIQQYGVTRLDVIQPLLATRAALETGTVAQKAELVANLIFDFGVDLQSLDAVLHHKVQSNGGQIPQPQRRAPQAPAAPQVDINALVQEALSKHPLIESYQQRQTQAAEEAISTISSHPNFMEVKDTVADVLESAVARGKPLELAGAFDIALRMHGYDGYQTTPQTQQERDAAGRFAASKRAASSISGAPKPSPGYKPGSGSIRDELLNALNSR